VNELIALFVFLKEGSSSGRGKGKREGKEEEKNSGGEGY
jgi:hypothetical protein